MEPRESAQVLSADLESRVRRAVTPEIANTFRRDGAACVRGLFNETELAWCRQGIDENIANPSPQAIVASRPDDPGFFLEDFCNWKRIMGYRRFIFESPASAAAGALIGCGVVRLFHDHLLVKEPHTKQLTPWHQDQPYYNVEGSQNCSMWFPVDPVSTESTLRFVAGSHRGPWLMPRTFLTAEARWFREGTLAELPDIDRYPERYQILGWELEPGDAVFFHMLTLHSAGRAGRGRRRVLSVRFLGDDMRHAPRKWKTSPDFPGLEAELPAGAPMDHPTFPVLWRHSAA